VKKLLLDTHIWIWSLLDPKRLKPRVMSALKSRDNELWLSPISVWEVLTLFEKDRLGVKGSPEEWVESALGVAAFNEAPLSNEIVLDLPKWRMEHRDPADRLLVSTARVLDLTLVTADERLLALSGVKLLANR
jgi:PIN domain nuclease of toxin-antitoxin system